MDEPTKHWTRRRNKIEGEKEGKERKKRRKKEEKKEPVMRQATVLRGLVSLPRPKGKPNKFGSKLRFILNLSADIQPWGSGPGTTWGKHTLKTPARSETA